MRVPGRIDAESGRYSLVDGIPFELPVASHHSPGRPSSSPETSSTRCACPAGEAY
jgi:hypothetical protein